MALTEVPRRGEVWLVALGAGRVGEPGKTRPAVVISVDELGAHAADDLILVVPLSSSLARSALRVEIGQAAGVERPSRAVCRALRAVVRARFVRRLGSIERHEMGEIESSLALILGLQSTSGPG